MAEGGDLRRWHLGEDSKLLPTLVPEKVFVAEDSRDKSPEAGACWCGQRSAGPSICSGVGRGRGLC